MQGLTTVYSDCPSLNRIQKIVEKLRYVNIILLIADSKFLRILFSNPRPRFAYLKTGDIF